MRSVASALSRPTQQGAGCTSGETRPSLLQRTCACGGSATLGGECEACKTKKLLGQQVQPKLTIGSPHDAYEQEADRVAEQVMRMPDHGAQLHEKARSGIAPQRVARMPLLQRESQGDSQPPAEPAKPAGDAKPAAPAATTAPAAAAKPDVSVLSMDGRPAT